MNFFGWCFVLVTFLTGIASVGTFVESALDIYGWKAWAIGLVGGLLFGLLDLIVVSGRQGWLSLVLIVLLAASEIVLANKPVRWLALSLAGSYVYVFSLSLGYNPRALSAWAGALILALVFAAAVWVCYFVSVWIDRRRMAAGRR